MLLLSETSSNVESAPRLGAILVILIVIAFLPERTSTANILGFFPSQSRSDLLVHCSIAKVLAEAGHNVTVIGTEANIYPRAKYRYYTLSVPAPDSLQYLTTLDDGQSVPWQRQLLMEEASTMANLTLSHPFMRRLIRDAKEANYDLFILGYFMNDFHLGIASLYKCPIIVSTAMRPMYDTNRMVGNPLEVSYVPSWLTNYVQPMTFWERFMNILVSSYERTWLSWKMTRQMERYFCSHFTCQNGDLWDVQRNISLVFTNHHFTQGPIRPNVPAMVEIGGIQIPEQYSPLPQHIASHMENAIYGVIYISLGTNVECTMLPKAFLTTMFDVMSELGVHVLWKWGDCANPGETSNILYEQWFPQNDVLAHPKLKLFITHGGQNSITEAQYHGIPILGIPFTDEQISNVRNIEQSGFGRQVDYRNTNVAHFRETVNELLGNPLYGRSIKAFSQIYRDRPMTPQQTVLYWVDYVLRHNGAKHMRSPAADISQYHLLCLDLLPYFLLAVTLVTLLMQSCRWCNRGNKSEMVKIYKKSETRKAKETRAPTISTKSAVAARDPELAATAQQTTTVAELLAEQRKREQISQKGSTTKAKTAMAAHKLEPTHTPQRAESQETQAKQRKRKGRRGKQ